MMRGIGRRTLVGLSAVAVSLLLGGSALANGFEIVVTGGDLGFTVAPRATTFAPVTISTVKTTSEAPLAAFAVRDQRGTGAGWRVQMQALPLTTSDVRHELPLGSLTLAPPTLTAADTASPPPVVNFRQATAIDASAPITVASAGSDAGMGTYELAATSLQLQLPAAAYAATYQTTVTISLVTGPA